MTRFRVVLLAILLSFVSTALSALEGTIERAYLVEVTAVSGLRIRSAPDFNASVFAVIQFGARLLAFEEQGEPFTIENRTGRWTKVLYGAWRGWVFGGMLKPVQSSVAANDRILESFLIVPGKKAGLLIFGKELPADVHAAYGPPSSIDSRMCYWTGSGWGIRANFEQVCGKTIIKSAIIGDTRFRTADGIGVGSLFADVVAKFPGGKRSSGMDVEFFYEAGKASFGINRGRVSLIHLVSE